MSERQKACAAACGSNIIFGFSFLASSIAMEAADPLLLLAIRFLLSAVFMTLLILVGVVHIQLKGKRPWSLIPLGQLQPVI